MKKITAYGCAIIAKRLPATDTKGTRISVSMPEAKGIHKPLIVGWNTAEDAAQRLSETGRDVMTGDIYAAAVSMFLDKIRAAGFVDDNASYHGASTLDGYTFTRLPVADPVEPVELFKVDFTGKFCAPIFSLVVLGTAPQVNDWAKLEARSYGAEHTYTQPLRTIPVVQWESIKLGAVRVL